MAESAEKERRQVVDMIGQVKKLLPIIGLLCAGAAAWALQKKATEDNTAAIVRIVDDVSVLKQAFAAQTAILERVERAVTRMERRGRRDD